MTQKEFHLQTGPQKSEIGNPNNMNDITASLAVKNPCLVSLKCDLMSLRGVYFSSQDPYKTLQK
jgi:hypothetical protein